MKLLQQLQSGLLILWKFDLISVVSAQWDSSWSIHPNSSLLNQLPFQVFRNIAISGNRVCSYYNQLCTICQIFMDGNLNGRFYSETTDAPIYYIAVAGTKQLSVVSITGNQTTISARKVRSFSLPYDVSALDIDYTHRWLVVSGSTAAMSLSLADPVNPNLISTVTYNRTGIGRTVRAIALYKDLFCASSGLPFFRCTDFKYGILSPSSQYTDYPYGFKSATEWNTVSIRIFDDIFVILASGADWKPKVQVFNRTTRKFLYTLCENDWECGSYHQYDMVRSSSFLIRSDTLPYSAIFSFESAMIPQRVYSFDVGLEWGSEYQFMDEYSFYVSDKRKLALIDFVFPPGMNYSSFYEMSEFNGYGLAKPFLSVERSVKSIQFKEMGPIPFNSISLIVIDTYMPENNRIRYFVETPLMYFQLTVNDQSLESTDSFSVDDLESNQVLIKPVSLNPQREVMKIKACYQGHCISTEIELIVRPRPSQTPAPDPSKNSPSDTDTTNWWTIFTLIIWACAFKIFFLIGFLAYSYGAVQGIFQSEKTSATFYSDMTDSSLVSAFSYTSAEASTTQTGTSSYSSADVTLQAGNTSYSSADVTLQAGSTINSTREHQYF